MTPRTPILLDVLGTLVHDPFYDEIPAFFGMTLEELLAVKHPTSWIEFECGRIDESEYLRNFFADGRAFDHDAFLECVDSAYRFLDGMDSLLRDLSGDGTRISLFSNYPVWYRRIERRCALTRWAHWDFVSCEMGVRKPDPEAYRIVLDALGRPARPPFFADDREANVGAACEHGFDAVRFEGPDELRRELARRGLLKCT